MVRLECAHGATPESAPRCYRMSCADHYLPVGEEGRQEVASSAVGNQAVVQKVTIVAEPANYSGVSGLVISSAFGAAAERSPSPEAVLGRGYGGVILGGPMLELINGFVWGVAVTATGAGCDAS